MSSQLFGFNVAEQVRPTPVQLGLGHYDAQQQLWVGNSATSPAFGANINLPRPNGTIVTLGPTVWYYVTSASYDCNGNWIEIMDAENDDQDWTNF